MTVVRVIAEEVSAFVALSLFISTIVIWSAIFCGA
jgi:hypothetical protein